MKLLLLGAGFSRNWGGWLASEAFEYLLGCPEIVANREVTELLWRYKSAGGFEEVLARVRLAWMRDNKSQQGNLDAIQAGIGRMFAAMNAGFFSLGQFEFQQSQPMMVRHMLARFDAIFTLNQDLLLEHHYMPEGATMFSGNRWSQGCTPPGVEVTVNRSRENLTSFAKYDCLPTDHSKFKVQENSQPYFKLHGSSNWSEKHGAPLMIMGANKANDMKLFPLLLWYQEQFERYLMQERESHLMVIGYSFRDAHINQTIFRAVKETSLKMFVIDPSGADIAWQVNETRKAPIGATSSELEEVFQAGVIGASRRPLSQIFNGDQVEHAKVMRFLA